MPSNYLNHEPDQDITCLRYYAAALQGAIDFAVKSKDITLLISALSVQLADVEERIQAATLETLCLPADATLLEIAKHSLGENH